MQERQKVALVAAAHAVGVSEEATRMAIDIPQDTIQGQLVVIQLQTGAILAMMGGLMSTLNFFVYEVIGEEEEE